MKIRLETQKNVQKRPCLSGFCAVIWHGDLGSDLDQKSTKKRPKSVKMRPKTDKNKAKNEAKNGPK